MSFESEFEEIKNEFRRQSKEAFQLDQEFLGRDGPGSVQPREATQTYNRKLLALKKKFGLAQTE